MRVLLVASTVSLMPISPIGRSHRSSDQTLQKADFGHPPDVRDWRPYEGDAALAVDDPESCRALVDLAAAWVTESNGRAEAVAVEGDVSGLDYGKRTPYVVLSPHVLGSLTGRRLLRATRLAPACG